MRDHTRSVGRASQTRCNALRSLAIIVGGDNRVICFIRLEDRVSKPNGAYCRRSQFAEQYLKAGGRSRGLKLEKEACRLNCRQFWRWQSLWCERVGQTHRSGTMALDMHAAGPLQSITSDEIMRALNGVNLNFNNVRYSGVDIGHLLASVGQFLNSAQSSQKDQGFN
jgi:hypothetical protein